MKTKIIKTSMIYLMLSLVLIGSESTKKCEGLQSSVVGKSLKSVVKRFGGYRVSKKITLNDHALKDERRATLAVIFPDFRKKRIQLWEYVWEIDNCILVCWVKEGNAGKQYIIAYGIAYDRDVQH
jgi:hypothetical protein